MISNCCKALALPVPKENAVVASYSAWSLSWPCWKLLASVRPRRLPSVLGNPEVMHAKAVLNAFCECVAFAAVYAFIFLLGAAKFGLILFRALVPSRTHYALGRFIAMRRHGIGMPRVVLASSLRGMQ